MEKCLPEIMEDILRLFPELNKSDSTSNSTDRLRRLLKSRIFMYSHAVRKSEQEFDSLTEECLQECCQDIEYIRYIMETIFGPIPQIRRSTLVREIPMDQIEIEDDSDLEREPIPKEPKKHSKKQLKKLLGMKRGGPKGETVPQKKVRVSTPPAEIVSDEEEPDDHKDDDFNATDESEGELEGDFLGEEFDDDEDVDDNLDEDFQASQ
jgi:hypothetical protein